VARAAFAESQAKWTNKKAFLSLPIGKMDISNLNATQETRHPVDIGGTKDKKLS